MNNKTDREIIRPKSSKKSDPFAYCKWALGDWEARFYLHSTPHQAACAHTIKQMVNNPAWFKTKGKKIDPKQAVRDNKAKGQKR